MREACGATSVEFGIGLAELSNELFDSWQSQRASQDEVERLEGWAPDVMIRDSGYRYYYVQTECARIAFELVSDMAGQMIGPGTVGGVELEWEAKARMFSKV